MAAELLLKALQFIMQSLRSMDIPVAVIGGLAMSAWKYTRTTHDVDLLVGIDSRQSGKILNQLQALGIRPKHSPPVISLGRLNIIQLQYEPPDSFMEVQIDMLLAETDYLRTALDRRISATLPDVPVEIDVLTCEDLILHKLLAGRIIDRVDVVSLLRLNYPSLDLKYLTGWIKRQNLSKEFSSIWREALPNETFPAN
jgi:hypothetical protein